MSTSNGTSSRPVDRVLAELAARLATEAAVDQRWPTTDGTGYAQTQRLDAERARKDYMRAYGQGMDTWAGLIRMRATAVLAAKDTDDVRGLALWLAADTLRWVADIDSREEGHGV